MNGSELKLWHWCWHPVYGVVQVIGRVDGREVRCVRVDGLGSLGFVCDPERRALVGPIAGPGRPPPAPNDRKDAERMADLFARRSQGRAEAGEATYYAYRNRFLDSIETWSELSDEERASWASVFADGNSAALDYVLAVERDRNKV